MTTSAKSLPTGLLAVWTDADPAGEADFNAWYDGQHLAERSGLPGFRNGARYMALQGAPRYFAVYDTDNPAVLRSAAYRARLDGPTAWTQSVMPHFRGTVRAVCRIVTQHGRGLGGVLRTYRLEPVEGGRDALRDGLGQLVQGLLAEQDALLRIRLAEVEGEPAAAGGTAETALRGPDGSATFSLLLEARELDALRIACRAVLDPARLAKLGAASPVLEGDYRLLYALGPGF